METLDYATGSLKSAKSWPEWATMNRGEEFKVVFRLPRDLPFLRADQEFNVKKHLGHWYFKIPGMYMVFQGPGTKTESTKDRTMGQVLKFRILSLGPESKSTYLDWNKTRA